MEKITTINGNGQPVTKSLPCIIIESTQINEVALAHIKENTGLDFVRSYAGYEAQPTESSQIAALLMSYNFKTRYFDNWDYKNTLKLKFDHHVGYNVDSICYNCAKENKIPTTNLKPTDRLAC
jgi:hypothetical protein